MSKFLICQPELKNKVYDLATKYFALLGVDWIASMLLVFELLPNFEGVLYINI